MSGVEKEFEKPNEIADIIEFNDQTQKNITSAFFHAVSFICK